MDYGFIKTIMDSVFFMWDHRNEVLFLEDKVDRLSSLENIKEAVAQERRLGIGNLDMVFEPYFQLSSSAFSKMKSIGLRRWLSMIRQA